MEEYINQYFDLIERNLDKNLENEKISFYEKEKIKMRKEMISEMKNNITWQFKKEEDKQIDRIQWLATMRRANTPQKHIEKQRKAIHIYELIISTIPYLKALNSSILEKSIIKFVNNFANLIDFSGRNFSKEFPSNTEIDEVFKSYFEIIKPAKGNGNMFEECYDKIEFLYNELKKMND